MTGMGFRVLGPVEVWRDDRPLARQTARHRAVLAALLVDAGRTVPLDVLIDRVWDGRPPAAPLPTLQAVISKLRRELEPDVAAGPWTVLLTRNPGYRLEVSPDEVDALRFGALLRNARELAERDDVEAARSAVGAGLALWRGPAYADVAAAFAAAEAERLEQLRLDARELAAELDLRLGRHAELVEELRELVRAQPLREGLRASLMLALYRAGRQAEALAVYSDGRRLLADELGVDPGRHLQDLHERMLRQDPGLAVPSPRPPAAPPAPAAPPPPAPRTDALPAPLTTFIGRERELAATGAALTGQRLVTLVGPGGSGKTRLALEAARRRPADAPPAVLVELAGIDAPELVPGQIATAVGVNLTAGDALGALVPALQGRPLLLLLDNCEHVVDAAAEATAALVARCPDLRVLATSREPLGVQGEAVLPCGPMGAAGPDSDAVRLFLDRARLAAPHLADPSPDELDVVAEVVAELDGLPLAVELAAACLGTLPLPEVAARVDDRFELLSGGWRTAAPHQRTLAATVQWSVDLLDPAQLAVFRGLSVFVGSFSPDAVEAVVGPDLDGGTLPHLRVLVAKSLVELDHGRGRYRMLETLRQYADQSLSDDERRRLRDRHAAFVARLTDGIEPTLRGRDGAAGWARLDAEQPNVRAALAHAVATGQTATALRIAGSVGWWWYRRGHVQEGRRWIAAALDGGADAPVRDRTRALLNDGLLAYLAGDMAAVWQRGSEIVEIAPENDPTLPLCLVMRGYMRAVMGPDPEGEGARDVARGLGVIERTGLTWVNAEVTFTLGQAARAAGDRDAALAHLDRAAALAEELGHVWAWESAIWMRAKVLIDLGRGAEAVATVSQVLAVTVREDDTTSTLAGLLAGAGAATAAGRPRDGAVLLGAVADLARRVGYDPLRMDPLDGHAYVEATRAALSAEEYAAAREEGTSLDLAGACALVHGLVAATAR